MLSKLIRVFSVFSDLYVLWIKENSEGFPDSVKGWRESANGGMGLLLGEVIEWWEHEEE